MSLLEKIKSPKDLKQLNIKELPILAEEIRKLIIDVSSKNGGHLASSLGAVDAIVALYYVFDFPKDKLIFDVGHQAYAHKILSERLDFFNTIRTEGGLSGFPNIFESNYDAFTVGHAGTSLSASLGYAQARDRLGEDYFVISFVGDGSFFNGENLEALFTNEVKPKKFMVILNDNGMSISKNTNGLYKVASKISMRRKYSKFMDGMNKIFGNSFIGRGLKKIKAWFKHSLDSYSMLDLVGFKYIGAFDGNNIKLLVRLFESFKSSPRTTFLHIKTKKGKGYEPAENQAEFFHGVSKDFLPSVNTFSYASGEIVEKIAEKHPKTVVVTAGMALGTGMLDFSKKYPDRFFDVGISEEFAVTFSAGMAIAGLKPILCIYSTFLQRGYDQIIEDVCLQKQPVIFLIDRAGVVGYDGSTHQGVFDLSYLSHVPNITIMSPKDSVELENMLEYALSLNAPVAIRYPNGKYCEYKEHLPLGGDEQWETIKKGDGACILACGARMLELAIKASDNTNAQVVNARIIKPLDEKLLTSLKGRKVITLEDNSKIGGFGSLILEYANSHDLNYKITLLGIEDGFVEHASISTQLDKNGISVDKIKQLL